VFVFGYKTGLLSVLKFPISLETEDWTAVAVFDSPGNFQSSAVLVQSSLSLFPVLGLDFQALTQIILPLLSLAAKQHLKHPSYLQACIAQLDHARFASIAVRLLYQVYAVECVH